MGNEEIEGITFFRSYYEAMEELSDTDYVTLSRAMNEYCFRGVEPQLSGIPKMLFIAFKPNMDNTLKHIKDGKKGGRPKKTSVSEVEKGGFLKTEKGGYEKTKSNKDKNKNMDKNKDEDLYQQAEEVPFLEIKNLYLATCPRLSNIRSIDGERKKHVTDRYKKIGASGLTELFQKANDSDFLCGESDSKWQADFDWLIDPTNSLKVLEGKYDNKKSASTNIENETRQDGESFFSDWNYYGEKLTENKN